MGCGEGKIVAAKIAEKKKKKIIIIMTRFTRFSKFAQVS
jgi:hypothetical protein